MIPSLLRTVRSAVKLSNCVVYLKVEQKHFRCTCLLILVEFKPVKGTRLIATEYPVL